MFCICLAVIKKTIHIQLLSTAVSPAQSAADFVGRATQLPPPKARNNNTRSPIALPPAAAPHNGRRVECTATILTTNPWDKTLAQNIHFVHWNTHCHTLQQHADGQQFRLDGMYRMYPPNDTDTQRGNCTIILGSRSGPVWICATDVEDDDAWAGTVIFGIGRAYSGYEQ